MTQIQLAAVCLQFSFLLLQVNFGLFLRMLQTSNYLMALNFGCFGFLMGSLYA